MKDQAREVMVCVELYDDTAVVNFRDDYLTYFLSCVINIRPDPSQVDTSLAVDNPYHESHHKQAKAYPMKYEAETDLEAVLATSIGRCRHVPSTTCSRPTHRRTRA